MKRSLKAILVTGSASFMGSKFVSYFLDNYENYQLIHLDMGDLECSVSKVNN